jgi:hypothetical protein
MYISERSSGMILISNPLLKYAGQLVSRDLMVADGGKGREVGRGPPEKSGENSKYWREGSLEVYLYPSLEANLFFEGSQPHFVLVLSEKCTRHLSPERGPHRL